MNPRNTFWDTLVKAGVGLGCLILGTTIATVLYLTTGFEREAPDDNGSVIYEGGFPHDAIDADPHGRDDIVIAMAESRGRLIGTIEARDRCRRLVFRLPGAEEETLWQYQDYSSVDRITFEASTGILRLYYDRTLLREKYYVAEIDTRTLKKRTLLIELGRWRL